MPSATSRGTLARQWELIKLVPAKKPGKKSSELKDELANAGFLVSKRQVERDLNGLAQILPIASECEGNTLYWYWLQDPKGDLPGITLADALSLKLVEQSMRNLVPQSMLNGLAHRFALAETKLSALSASNNHANWLTKVRCVQPTLSFLPPEVDLEILTTIQEALLRDRQLQVSYRRMQANDSSERRLHPLGLVQRGQVLYLVARAYEYSDVRLYALHRITSAITLEESIEIPEGFTLDSYLSSGAMDFGRGKVIELTAWVADHLAQVLDETPLAGDQKLTPHANGGYNLQVTTNDSWQLKWWIIGQGASIIIKSPVEFRSKIVNLIQSAAENYNLLRAG